MPRQLNANGSQVLRDFLEIEENAFHQRIRFFETHQDEILLLPEKEEFVLKEAYADALFQVGAYRKHLTVVDKLIEESIQQNIRFFKGEDIFQGLLFKKSASLYQLHRYGEAEHILKELIRINPAFPDPATFLTKCLRRKRPPWLNRAKAASVFLFILTAGLISVEMLVMEPFFEDWAADFERVRFGTFGLGIVCLVGGEVWHRLECKNRVRLFVQQARQRKKWDLPSS